MKKLKAKQSAELQKTIDSIDTAKGEVEYLLQEVQDAYDSKSDKWKESEAGSAVNEQIEALGEVMDELDGAMDKLRGVHRWGSDVAQ